jgi:hypothetical protein
MNKKYQLSKLESILKMNGNIQKILKRAPGLRMPNWHLASGCIPQTVWNVLHGFEPDYSIKDYDLVYYDSSDTTPEGEDAYVQMGKELFKDISAEVEIKNQARVHLWFERKFGFKIPPYQSAEDAISSWSTTATCIGVRCVGNKLGVYAPYGLDDIFQMIVRPAKRLFTKEMYENKVNRWMKMWPKIKVIPWDSQ